VIAGNTHKRVIRERKEREKDQRVRSILDAAKKVFFSKGYLRATMDEIALAAEVSKPTIYHYFKTKDDLYFSLMLPVVDDIGQGLDEIWKKLLGRRYRSGVTLIRDLFKGLYHAYEAEPDSFKIVQIFQQTGLVGELNEPTRSALDERGGSNFQRAREILAVGVEQGLLKPVDPHQMVDVLWGLFVGIIQLEDIKAGHKKAAGRLQSTLQLAQELLVAALLRIA
jgi:TetR/AcrR family transcriptional regulator